MGLTETPRNLAVIGRTLVIEKYAAIPGTGAFARVQGKNGESGQATCGPHSIE
ncbi:hypothetical protein AB4Z38_21915 [Arthrobacter sp. 2RAF6]|uniref:hypothetical protein n=1 Tax=Arthrobacter sp. 2RAF6 TaxID=3233002 RepID=UPI003F938119